ncbi:RNA-binding cell elongation regulator Jag/EloR [Calderihabitans maritimus]|uniref:RNA-binding protein KhpB n=1 Tax=Calderihabitans maritimus TaxID=1246530 RepID=A0A1Z5HWD7_9FIRM|nr:RNA-binding cell elongation regulator Jag/EloR [Calderihabitans maritimus]GAW93651.1 putative RNA-binding protein [Calderihabitans maritimus]
MKSIEVSGKTVEEAVNMALEELQAEREEVEVEILEHPSKGLFGLIGSKLAKVRVTLKEDPIRIAQEFLLGLIRRMGVHADISIAQKDEYTYLTLTGSDLGILIGRRGETLNALQYLVNLVVNRKVEKRIKIILDVEGYRSRREQTLIRLARRLSEKVKRTGNRIVLEPMNPHERRVIHTALQNDNSVYTYSEGEEPYRKVVISLKNK